MARGLGPAICSRSLFLAVWEAASLVAPSYLLPGPGLVALRLWSFVTSWRDLGHLGASLFHVGAAIAISFVIGSLLALIPYYVPVLRFAIERRIGPFLNAFSAIGWTLLAIMWFGVTPGHGDLRHQRRAGAVRARQHGGRPRQHRPRDHRDGATASRAGGRGCSRW